MNRIRSDAPTTLVLGGTGKTGRRVAQRLAQAGHPARIGSRSAGIPFDWLERSTWPRALHGVAAAYVAYQPDLAVPGAVDTVRAFFELAADQGVRKLVLLSGRGEDEARQAEQALQAMDVEWTILRSSWFSQNFSESYFLDSVLAGELVLPVGLAAEPFVDVEDIAEIAFHALTGSGHAGRLYELTGPEAITFSAAVSHIGEVIGRRIAFVEVPAEPYRDALVQQGLPAGEVDLIMYLLTTVLDGRNVPLGDGVQRALGRAPGSFIDYVRRTAASGVWAGRDV